MYGAANVFRRLKEEQADKEHDNPLEGSGTKFNAKDKFDAVGQ